VSKRESNQKERTPRRKPTRNTEGEERKGADVLPGGTFQKTVKVNADNVRGGSMARPSTLGQQLWPKREKKNGRKEEGFKRTNTITRRHDGEREGAAA